MCENVYSEGFIVLNRSCDNFFIVSKSYMNYKDVKRYFILVVKENDSQPSRLEKTDDDISSTSALIKTSFDN